MTTIVEQARQGELALAAYADLAQGVPDTHAIALSNGNNYVDLGSGIQTGALQ